MNSIVVPLLVAWLSLLTVLTVFEIVELPLSPDSRVADEPVPDEPSLRSEIESLQEASKSLWLQVGAAKEKLTELIEQVKKEEEKVRFAFERLRAAKSRGDRHRRVEELEVQLSVEELAKRRSGYLETFPHLEVVESLLGRPVVQRSYTAEELRLWRARVDAHLAELTPLPAMESTFGGVTQRAFQLYVLHLQNRSDEIDKLWPEYFDSEDRPIYKPLFASDSVEHPSNAQGIKLHLQYNT